MPPHQACSRSGPATPIQISRGAAITERYLEYAAHGGFNNQRRNLFHALLMAHALNRTLLLPPAPRCVRDALEGANDDRRPRRR